MFVTIDMFPTMDEKVEVGITEHFDREIVFEMKGVDCVDVTFDGVWFDF